jgi:transcriptional regulator with XRE-family HTH domain
LWQVFSVAPRPKKTKGAKAKPSHKALGRAVAQIREEKGLTQAEVARKTSLHVTYISGIENGARNPTWTVLTQIARALGVPVSELAARAEQQK